MAAGKGLPVPPTSTVLKTSSRKAAEAYAKQFGYSFYRTGGKYVVYSTYQEEKIPETIGEKVGVGGAGGQPFGEGGTAGGRPDRNILIGGGMQGGGLSSRQIAGRLNEKVTFDVPLPIQGVNKAYGVETPLDTTSGDMLNVRAKDTLDRRVRLGQRPGMEQAYSQLIGANSNFPIVAMAQIITVE